MSDYKIELGISLNDGDFNSIKTKINSLEDNPIKLKIDAETKELVSTIKDAIRSLSTGAKNVLTFDTSKVETSLNDVALVIKDIKTSIGTIDNKSGMKSLVSSVNQIGTALDKASNQLTELTRKLNTVGNVAGQSLNIDDVIDKQVVNLMERYAIAGKKGSKAFEEIRQAVVNYRKELASIDGVGTDDILGSFSNVSGSRQVTSALANHIKFANEAKESYRDLYEFIKAVNASGAKVHLPDSVRQELGDDYTRVRSKLGSAFTSGAGQDLEGFLIELNSLHGGIIDMSQGVESALLDLYSKLNIAKGKNFISGDELFGLGYLKFDEVENDVISTVNAINSAVNNVGSNVDISGIATQLNAIVASLNEIKTSVQRLNSTISIDGLTQGFDKLSNSIELLIQNCANIKSVIDNGIGNVGTSVGQTNVNIDNIENGLKQVTASAKNASDSMQQTANEAKNISRINTASDIVDGFNQADIEIGQTESRVESLRSALKSLGLGDASVDKIIKDFEKLGVTVTRVTGRLNDNDSLRLTVKGINNDGDIVTHTNNFKSDGSQGAWSTSVTHELNEVEKTFNRLKTLATEFRKISIAIELSDNDEEIKSLKSRLASIQKEYGELFDVKKLSPEQLNFLNLESEKTSQQLDTIRAKIRGLEAEAAKKIKIDVEVGKFDEQFDGIERRFNNLSRTDSDLQVSFERLKSAYKELNVASEPNADGTTDVKRLIKAQEEYAEAVQRTTNLLKKQERVEKDTVAAERLASDKKSLSLDMQNWLKNNTKAAKEYGDAIRELDARLDKLGDLDRAGFNNIKSQFKDYTKEADNRGLTGLTWFDKVKEKFGQYASYFSVAEAFMYAEEALRDMFEQVKLIDSAMTELRKVTNETDASYSQFLSNAAKKSKEIGTTIDGYVSSTADFARLGYGFEESQKLAEVANIYAVVGDEIDGVEGATQSLVSTLAAFRDETSGISDDDFAMDIIDKFNEVNILAS